MVRKSKLIKIRKYNQQYLINILIDNPKINSGRKNYKSQYIRVLKNILLTHAYKITLNKNIEFFFKNIRFKENKKFFILSINI